MRYPGPGSHAQYGILAWGVMHSEVSWSGKSCTVMYLDPGSRSTNVRFSRHRESCTVRYPEPGSHATWHWYKQFFSEKDFV